MLSNVMYFRGDILQTNRGTYVKMAGVTLVLVGRMGESTHILKILLT